MDNSIFETMQQSPKNIHLIAMGGSVMHALAIALKQQGFNVTGSDDQYFDPAKSALEKAGLKVKTGWSTDAISDKVDFVVLGMHAQKDNPELLKAQKLGVTIYSFPEFIYQHSKNKQRIVIGGSHGKTTITAMMMHVLKFYNKKFDFVVGADVIGFNNRVKLSDAPIIIIEGDEYLSSRIDPTPKFLRYQHHIGVISGIAWDHINVFKTEADYVEQFRKFVVSTPKAGSLVYNEEDVKTKELGAIEGLDINYLPFTTLEHSIKNGITYVKTNGEEVKVTVFGKHNLSNMAAAKETLVRLGINEKEFLDAIQSFELPSLRLNELFKKDNFTIYRDYAHAPSKVKATTEAVKAQNTSKSLVAVLELHTYSSLNKDFLPHYKNSLAQCDQAIVFVDPEAIAIKKLPPISSNDIESAFDQSGIRIVTNAEELKDELLKIDILNTTLLLMSSGNFGGLDFKPLFS
ncbi:MAG: Mur ligase domain-containing protein [Cyclobacteriaceae bacterium]|nr:Mur ligase domain-containing protein [Cyclobacteriaceae bacterium]